MAAHILEILSTEGTVQHPGYTLTKKKKKLGVFKIATEIQECLRNENLC